VGVNVVGAFEAELGVGEMARQVVAAFDAARVDVLPLGYVASASRQGHPFAHVPALDAGVNLFPTTIMCVNADGFPRFRERLGREFFAGRRTVGLWWWEATVLPDWMAESFALVDAVWAGSSFVADVLRAAAPAGVPVHQVDIPVRVPRPARIGRGELGLPKDRFVVLYLFDHNSVLDRKYPLGALEAFTRAFPAGDATLVLKSINGDAHSDAHARVAAAAADRDDVLVKDGYLDAPTRDALLATCDCYLSPHRSEGFGLTIAEALLLERPVVATAWSGSADLVDERTAWPIRHSLRPVGIGNEPYPADAEWAEPDLDHAAAQLRAVRANPEDAARRAAAGAAHVANRWSAARCGKLMAGLLRGGRSRPDWTPSRMLARRRAAARAREFRRKREVVGSSRERRG
jgi:glycosyltransferase involved in cell wall biosynthesis